MVITVTLLRNSGAITNSTVAVPAPFADESFDSPDIDFYFFMSSPEHDSRPSANVKVQSCSPDGALGGGHLAVCILQAALLLNIDRVQCVVKCLSYSSWVSTIM